MRNNPLISVIIPVYNGERFLSEALQSVQTQTYTPGEIIVVDDGSIDMTAEIVKNVVLTSSIPMRYMRQENQGPSAARNHGVSVAIGEMLAFLDADDVWIPNKLEKQSNLLNRDLDLGYAGCHLKPLLLSGLAWPKTLNAAYWQSQPPSYTTSALLIRRHIWEKVGPFNPEQHLGEDVDWVMRASDLGVKASVISEVLLIKRLHDKNLTHQPAMGNGILAAARRSIRRKQGVAVARNCITISADC